jgi:type IV secretory pathway VirJ component
VIEGTGHGFSRPNRWGSAFDHAFGEIWRQADLASAAGGDGNDGDSASHARASSSPAMQQIAGELDRLQLPLQYRWAAHPRAVLLFVSGDGGWASLDEGVATMLQQHDISVVGISSLRYFWKERAPERVGQDFHAIVAALDRLDVPVFIGGYSFGAAVVPIALTHWPEADRQRLAGLALVTPGPSASFEIDPLDWVRTPKENPATRIAPALRAIGLPTLCVLGTTEDADECPSERDSVDWSAAHGAAGVAADVSARGVAGVPQGRATGLRIVRLPGSHHFHGDYAAVGRAIADFISDRAAATDASPRAAQAVRRSTTTDGRKGPIS